MIRGDKPSGYGVTRDTFGREIVTEYRQCSHCQTTWPYIKGVSFGRKVGICDYCNGLLCENCVKTRWTMVDRRCVPYSEGINDRNFVIDPFSGLFIRK